MINLYDGAIKILDSLIAEYKKEGLSDSDIIDCLDFTLKILNRIPIITQKAKDSLSEAINAKKKELGGSR